MAFSKSLCRCNTSDHARFGVKIVFDLASKVSAVLQRSDQLADTDSFKSKKAQPVNSSQENHFASQT